jgi:hypothetical protein
VYRVTFIIAVATACFAGPASGQDYRGVGFAGFSIGDGASGYAGGVIALPGARLGRGFAVRGTVNGGQYRYTSGGVRIEADYRGAEAALVYQTSGDWGYANFGAGPRVTDTSLSPNDPLNERRGTRWDAGITTDGSLNLAPAWRLNWYGSLGVVDGPYQARIGVGRVLDEARQTRLGIEAAIAGDPRYTTTSGGVFLASRIGPNLDGTVTAGVLKPEGRDVQPFGSVGLSILF